MPAFVYNGTPIAISQDSTLRFVAVDPETGVISDLYEESYQFYTDAVATVPAFTVQATFAPPSVVVVPSGSVYVTIPSFTAQATFSPPAVTGQQQAIVSVPSFEARATYTPPTVTATTGVQAQEPQSATVSVPQFSVTAVFLPPLVRTNVTSSGSIRGPDGASLDLRDIYGNAIILQAA